MEIVKVSNPESVPGLKVYKDERVFFIDEIYPLMIRHMGKDEYTILFLGVVADATDGTGNVCFNVPIKVDDNRGVEYFATNPLNYNNITKNKELLEFYVESTKGIEASNLFLTDFDLEEVPGKPLYHCIASRKTADNTACVADINMNRECFVKLNLFFVRLQNYNALAAGVFANIKLKNIKYSKIDHIKLDGSGTDLGSKLVCSHYTCGNGPETYKFNFLSMKLDGRRLRCPMTSEVYEKLYSKDFVIVDIFYYEKKDQFFILYEVRSDITDKFKETKALILSKEFYDKTNIVNEERIYEKET